jgi:hypothetical protein
MKAQNYSQIDYQGMLKIDTIEWSTNCVVVISLGKAKVRELPEHNEYKICDASGKG